MVTWSKDAILALKQIHDFIALDSRQYAQKVALELWGCAEELSLFPHKGRIVPEMRQKLIREVFVYSYRMIYQISSTGIIVLQLVHQRKKLNKKVVLSKN